MNMHKIKQAISTYFIVVAIFLFGANTAVAISTSARPYLPVEKPTWPEGVVPLLEAASKIQRQHPAKNHVEWVNGIDSEEKFSYAGLTAISGDEILPQVTINAFMDADKPIIKIFNGFVDSKPVVSINSTNGNKHQPLITAIPGNAEEESIQEKQKTDNMEQKSYIINDIDTPGMAVVVLAVQGLSTSSVWSPEVLD